MLNKLNIRPAQYQLPLENGVNENGLDPKEELVSKKYYLGSYVVNQNFSNFKSFLEGVAIDLEYLKSNFITDKNLIKNKLDNYKLARLRNISIILADDIRKLEKLDKSFFSTHLKMLRYLLYTNNYCLGYAIFLTSDKTTNSTLIKDEYGSKKHFSWYRDERDKLEIALKKTSLELAPKI